VPGVIAFALAFTLAAHRRHVFGLDEPKVVQPPVIPDERLYLPQGSTSICPGTSHRGHHRCLVACSFALPP
jgi:hypothetical protein